MSTWCEKREHLSIETISEEGRSEIQQYVLDNLKFRLGELAGLVVTGNARIKKMSCTLDGRNYVYKSDGIDISYQKIIYALEDAEKINFIIEYGYKESVFLPASEFFDYSLNKLKEVTDLEPDECRGVHYSIWEMEDSSDPRGWIYYFGERDGTSFNGYIESETIESFPEGTWKISFALSTEYVNFDDKDFERVKQIILELDSFTDFHINQNIEDVLFRGQLNEYIEDVVLKSPGDYAKFLELVKELFALAGEEADDINMPEGMFFDFTGDDVRQLRINYDEQLNPEFEYYSID